MKGETEMLNATEHSRQCHACGNCQAVGNKSCTYCHAVFGDCCEGVAIPASAAASDLTTEALAEMQRQALKRADTLADAVQAYRVFRDGYFPNAELFVEGLQKRRRAMWQALEDYRK